MKLIFVVVSRYRWLAYINPSYYALSSVTFFILEDFNACEGTQFECFFSSGEFILRTFFFDKINPYLHLLVCDLKTMFTLHVIFGQVLLIFTVAFLGLAVLANWAHNTHIKSIYKSLFIK